MSNNTLEKIIDNRIKEIEYKKRGIPIEQLEEYIIEFENLLGDDAKFNASKMINIFKGEDNDFSKAVCLNSAAGLIVSGKFSNFKDAYSNAREHILSGKTFEHLKGIQNG